MKNTAQENTAACDLTLPEGDGLRWDLRNREWTRVYNEAIRFINYNTHIYRDDVWVPIGLKQGDIMRADLMTAHNGAGSAERCPRNTLFIGALIDKQTMQVMGMAVMPLSYNTLDHNPEHEILISPYVYPFKELTVGLRREALLRSARVDYIPVNSEHLGFFVDRNGLIKKGAFKAFQQSIDAGAQLREKRGLHVTDKSFSLDDCYLVPSLNPDLWDEEAPFTLSEHEGVLMRYADLSVEDQSLLKAEYKEDLLFQLMESRVQRLKEKDHRFQMTAGRLRREREDLRIFKEYVRNNRPDIGDEGMAHIVSAAIKSITANTPEKLEGDDQRLTQSQIPSIKTLLDEQMAIYIGQLDVKARGLASIFNQYIDGESLSALVDLGIGGLNRDEKIELPQQLWRGRVIMMRVPDLNQESMKNDAVRRPCVIHKVYAKIDENTGEPLLAGIEAYPYTRSQAASFTYKMGIRSPVKSKRDATSWLIADVMIRAPLTEEYFHPRQAADLYFDPTKSQMEVFDVKRKVQTDRGLSPRIYGMKEIPADWIEIDLPETPSEQMRSKLRRMGMTGATVNVSKSKGGVDRKIRQRKRNYG